MHAIIGCTDHAKDDVRFGRTEIPEQENMVEPELNIEHFSSINTFLPELCDFLIIFTVFSSCPSTSISKKLFQCIHHAKF